MQWVIPAKFIQSLLMFLDFSQMFTTALLSVRVIHPGIFSMAGPKKNFFGLIIVLRDAKILQILNFFNIWSLIISNSIILKQLEHLFP